LSGNGGAVYAAAAGPGGQNTTVQVTNCTFDDDQARTPGDTYDRSGSTGWGGAIYTNESLTVTGKKSNGSTFTNNLADSGGGAIAYGPVPNAYSQMFLSNTYFNNDNGPFGGAVSDYVSTNQGGVYASVNACLFQVCLSSGATADLGYQNGGAINVSQTTSGTGSALFVVQNSTFYGNRASDEGGALALASANSGTGTNEMQLTSLTVTQNQAGVGGGGVWINQTAPALLPQVWNSIFAADSIMASGNALNGPDVLGAVNSSGHNLVGASDGSTGWNPARFDQWGVAVNPLNPLLDPVGPTNNGDFTSTIRLMQGSPAYQEGDPALAGTMDQRGRIRQWNPQQGVYVSIGAYDPQAQ
jgi:hypothetical protein